MLTEKWGDELLAIRVPIDDNPLEQKILTAQELEALSPKSVHFYHDYQRKNAYLWVNAALDVVILGLGNIVYRYNTKGHLIKR